MISIRTFNPRITWTPNKEWRERKYTLLRGIKCFFCIFGKSESKGKNLFQAPQSQKIPSMPMVIEKIFPFLPKLIWVKNLSFFPNAFQEVKNLCDGDKLNWPPLLAFLLNKKLPSAIARLGSKGHIIYNCHVQYHLSKWNAISPIVIPQPHWWASPPSYSGSSSSSSSSLLQTVYIISLSIMFSPYTAKDQQQGRFKSRNSALHLIKTTTFNVHVLIYA